MDGEPVIVGDDPAAATSLKRFEEAVKRDVPLIAVSGVDGGVKLAV